VVTHPDSHYRALGVAPEATTVQARKAWIAAARKVHPDQLGNVSVAARAAADEKMLAVNEAWRVLSNEQLRREYDRTLAKETRVVVARQSQQQAEERRPPQGSGEESLQFLVRSRRAAQLIRAIPWLLGLVFVLGLLILTAQGTGQREEQSPQATLCAVIDDAGFADIVACALPHNATSERPVLVDRALGCEPGASRRDLGDSVLCFRLDPPE
jgi:hypothetical protein